MAYLLTGDVGGTKTLLQLTNPEGDSIYSKRYVSRDFQGLEGIIRQFLADVHAHCQLVVKPNIACLGLAGSIVGSKCYMVNLGWTIDARELEQNLGIERAILINDFTAVGYGVLGLDRSDLFTLQEIAPQDQAPIGVIGAGTGLGQGFLIWQQDRYVVYPSEGGHTDFAPRSDLEMELLKYLSQKFDRVSVERVVSGQGISNIYQFLWEYRKAEENEISRGISPEVAAQIANAAIAGTDPIATETIGLFLDCYAAEIGNLALKLLSYGGMYIAGGILPKLMRLLDQERFLATIKAKGRVSHLLDRVPFHIVLNPEVGLIGTEILGKAYL
jgi:glucokinase